MNPFVYPKSRHQRSQNPRPYKDYRSYKPYLRDEFSGQCVYCRLPDAIKGEETFGADHYRPQRKFPHLSSEYLNLYYACNRCNSNKSDFWPTERELTDGQFVPNPCEHIMFEHLRYKGEIVVSHSSTGTWAIELLDLNEDKIIEFRKIIIATIKLLVGKIDESERILAGIASRVATAQSPDELSELLDTRADLMHDIGEFKLALHAFAGNYVQI